MIPPSRTGTTRTRLIAALAITATLLAWQALAVPALSGVLQPWLGSAAWFTVEAISLLAGTLLMVRLLGSRAGGDQRGPMADRERDVLALGDALPIGMLAVRGDRVIRANAQARKQLGLGSGELPQVLAATLFADPDDAIRVLTGTLSHTDALDLRRGAETFRARLAVHDPGIGPDSVRVLMFEDLSEGDRLDARLEQQRAELHALAGRLLTVQEDERRLLSRELHDDVGQAITAIKLGAVALLEPPDRGSARPGGSGQPVEVAQAIRAEIINEIIATADETVIKLRNLSMLLRPPQLDALGLEAALRWQSQALFRAAPTALELALAPMPRLDPAIELACFRIAQEALTNVLRHSGAARVTVALAPRDDVLELIVEDDGCGFEPGGNAGLGLVTMRERAQQLGGSVRFTAGALTGTRLLATLPMTLPGGDQPTVG